MCVHSSTPWVQISVVYPRSLCLLTVTILVSVLWFSFVPTPHPRRSPPPPLRSLAMNHCPLFSFLLAVSLIFSEAIRVLVQARAKRCTVRSIITEAERRLLCVRQPGTTSPVSLHIVSVGVRARGRGRGSVSKHREGSRVCIRDRSLYQ